MASFIKIDVYQKKKKVSKKKKKKKEWGKREKETDRAANVKHQATPHDHLSRVIYSSFKKKGKQGKQMEKFNRIYSVFMIVVRVTHAHSNVMNQIST